MCLSLPVLEHTHGLPLHGRKRALESSPERAARLRVACLWRRGLVEDTCQRRPDFCWGRVKAAGETKSEGGRLEEAQKEEVRETAALSEFQVRGSVAQETEGSAGGLARREGEEPASAVLFSQAERGKRKWPWTS